MKPPTKIKVVILKFAYISFLGILVSVFIGVGIAAFYPSPKPPESLSFPTPVANPPTQPASQSAQYYQNQEKQIADQKDYQQKIQDYSKNVSMITLAFSVLLFLLSLTLFQGLSIVSDGLLLGSVLTLVYSIFRGFGSGDEHFRFIVVTTGLILTLLLGYIKYIKPVRQ